MIINIIFSGDLWQLPPIYDRLVTDNNHLDGRPNCAPSHWNQNFKIYYLTEKMRSSKDIQFSNLCDRVARGKITEDDEVFLKSRIQTTDSENDNEKFKQGKISIIVTTNKKRNLINSKKLTELLPFKKLYVCNSIDRVKNVPASQRLPKKFKDNPGKTGNLLSELNLKEGAPVVMTTNHSKRKYKEDGLVNGARGYVQSIQVSKDNPDKVEVIWVVFHKDIGKLYRHDHRHLRKNFDPGHELATPILPQRKNFTMKFGNVEYQRTNFPLSLAYAITAHKCQGETLEEVIIDFGPDLENNIKSYICAGSFYVALTRVKLGSKVFLRSFDKKYIKVDESIEGKVDAMRKFRPYLFKKIYIDEKIFGLTGEEVKLGYLNINGLLDGGHAQYLDADSNLQALDILVLAETKLVKENNNDQIEKKLSNWRIMGRYDAEDGAKHMGLMLLTSRRSSIECLMKEITHQTAKRENNLQVQGIIVRMISGRSFGFIYCRSTPTVGEVKGICKYFRECNILMGDFNLSHLIQSDQEKISKLCEVSKISLLKEITRSISHNQLDYILVDEEMKDICYVTSFNNFISDHKAIVARVGSSKNYITDEIKERIQFDQQSHLKAKYIPSSKSSSGHDKMKKRANDKDHSPVDIEQEIPPKEFTRRIKNPDMATCWLNSCLQLLFTAIDYDEFITRETYTSELGQELLKLHGESRQKSIDPSSIKDIIIAAEDVRIATRLSELSYEILNKEQLAMQSNQVSRTRLNLRTGQQCVRDFFICLNENLIAWPDVYSTLSFRLTNSTECPTCKGKNIYETTQIYLELPVPPNNEDLKEYVEDFLNKGSKLGCFCDGCNKYSQKIKQTSITSSDEAKFLTIVLTRGIATADGYHLVKNKILSTNSIKIRWVTNNQMILFKFLFIGIRLEMKACMKLWE